MTLLSPDASRLLLLKYISGNVVPGSPVAHLYANNITPSITDTVATYTESVAGGYTASTATSANWTFATVSTVDSMTYPAITFTFSGAETIYGYYVTNSSSVLLFSERFSSPITFSSGGGNLVLNLACTLQNA